MLVVLHPQTRKRRKNTARREKRCLLEEDLLGKRQEQDSSFPREGEVPPVINPDAVMPIREE
jgi:hypothetical protein